MSIEPSGPQRPDPATMAWNTPGGGQSGRSRGNGGGLGNLFDREERYEKLPGDYDAVKAYILSEVARG